MESWKNVVNILYVILSDDGKLFLGGKKLTSEKHGFILTDVLQFCGIFS